MVVKKKIMAEIVATTLLPVDRLSATDTNAAARANKVYLSYKDGWRGKNEIVW